MSMNQKIILITGASTGIGKACATYLSSKGHIVYGTSRNASFPPKKEEKNAPIMIQMDVHSDESVIQTIDFILQKHNTIDVVVNNAGFGIAGPIEETSITAAKQQFETNFFGVHRICKTVLPQMRTKQSGTIINISSIGGILGLPYQGFYSASKFAIEGYTEALRMEVQPFNIHVSLIEPGDIQSSFVDKRKKYIEKDSAYKSSFHRVMETIEEEERSGVSPQKIALCVEKIIMSSKPKTRYRVGAFSQKFAAGLKGKMPDGFITWALHKFYKV